jgi:hypothetical protein
MTRSSPALFEKKNIRLELTIRDVLITVVPVVKV